MNYSVQEKSGPYYEIHQKSQNRVFRVKIVKIVSDGNFSTTEFFEVSQDHKSDYYANEIASCD